MSVSSTLITAFKMDLCATVVIIIGFLIGTGDGQVCNRECLKEINDVMDFAMNLNTQLAGVNDNINILLNKVQDLETYDLEQFDRISRLENRLFSNITNVKNILSNDVQILSDLISRLQNDNSVLEGRVNSLQNQVNNLQNNGGGGGGGGGFGTRELQALYSNITTRINDLEFGKVLNLTIDNSMWRKNFRIVNTTFALIKKNNCLSKVCVGLPFTNFV